MTKRLSVILFAVAALGLFVLGAFGIVSPFIILAIAAAVAVYFFTGAHIAFLVVAAPILLLGGQFIRLEIRPNWFYEMSLSEVALAAAVLLFLIAIITREWKRPLRFDRTAKLLGAYLLLALASFFWSDDPQLFVAGIKVLVFSLAAYVLAVNTLSEARDMRAAMYSLCAFAGLLSLQLLYTLYRLGFSVSLFSDRAAIGVPFGPLALVAAVIALILPMLLGYYFDRPPADKARIFFPIVFIIGSAAVFVSLGKAAVLSLVLGLIYLFFKLHGRRIILMLSFLLCALCALVVLYPVILGFGERVSNIFSDGTTTFRVAEYKAGYSIFYGSPFLGVGVAQQIDLYRRILHPDYGQLANNYLLQAAMDLGLAGFILYVALIISIIKTLHDMNRQLPGPFSWGLTASTIVVAVNGLLEVTVFAVQYAIVLWIIFGLCRARLNASYEKA